MLCFICVCGIWLGYVEYKRHVFNKNPPKPVIEKTNSENTTEAETVELSDSSMPIESPEVSNIDAGRVKIEGEIPTSPPIDSEPEQVNKPLWPGIDNQETETIVPWEDPNTASTNYRDMDPEEYAEHWREKLKEQHGDIPEVDMFIQLHLALHKKEPMKLDDHVTFVELLNFFYPSGDNAKGLEEIKAYREELGGDTLLMPPK